MEQRYSGECISQVLMTFPGFNGNERFISVFTKLAIYVLFPYFCNIYLNIILTVLVLKVVSFLQFFWIKYSLYHKHAT